MQHGSDVNWIKDRLGALLPPTDRPTDAAALARLLADLRPVPIRTPLIRIGPPGDGGYLLPDDLDDLRVCISPGVSSEVGFDVAMAERGVEVFMADASVPHPPRMHPRFHFSPLFLGAVDGPGTVRLDTYCAGIPPHLDGDRLLQMDIEGAEWAVLLDTSPQTLARFRIMVIEFHDLHRLFGRFAFDTMRAVFAKLLQHHRVVHIHPNNARQPRRRGKLEIPPLMEFTFHRRDRAATDDAVTPRFPHPLDADCAPDRASVVLPPCWR